MAFRPKLCTFWGSFVFIFLKFCLCPVFILHLPIWPQKSENTKGCSLFKSFFLQTGEGYRCLYSFLLRFFKLFKPNSSFGVSWGLFTKFACLPSILLWLQCPELSWTCTYRTKVQSLEWEVTFWSRALWHGCGEGILPPPFEGFLVPEQ